MESIKNKYEKAKNAKVGEMCECPSCSTKFIKTNYQQAFCKSKKGTVCKDKYWNTVTPEKRNNTTRISPRSAAWLDKKRVDREDKLQLELEQDGSWDSHQCYVGRCEWCGYLICRCED